MMRRAHQRSRPVVVAVIPARSGSKGFPGKNTFPILGHPMIAWSVRAAVECPIVMHTFAISDGAGILKIAEQYGAQGILEPKRLGGDQVKNWQVMDYALRHIRSLGIEPDILVYLQTTSPQRTSNDIRRTLAHFDSPRIGGVISVSETDNKFLKSFLVRDGI